MQVIVGHLEEGISVLRIVLADHSLAITEELGSTENGVSIAYDGGIEVKLA